VFENQSIVVVVEKNGGKVYGVFVNLDGYYALFLGKVDFSGLSAE
jgi:hypothetical protein